ncbi:MAG: hypothetical protein QOH87_3975, partial [Trebonia sp.]|nr:hypothetical protein [Trebonia sp.]
MGLAPTASPGPGRPHSTLLVLAQRLRLTGLPGQDPERMPPLRAALRPAVPLPLPQVADLQPTEQFPHLTGVVEGHAVRPGPPVTWPEALPGEQPARYKSITDRRPYLGEISGGAERQAVPGMNQMRLWQHSLRERCVHDFHYVAAPNLATQD